MENIQIIKLGYRHTWGMQICQRQKNGGRCVQNIVKSAECINSEMYLAKNLALSVTDAYWVCPESVTLKYDQVKFTNLSMYSNGKASCYNATSYDYNASLGGQMENIGILSSRCQIL